MNEVEFQKRVSESLAFIDSCELGSCKHIDLMGRAAGEPAGEPAADNDGSEAVVANDSLVSIVAGMGKKNKQIVKDCILFASLTADKNFPDGGVQWYNHFKSAMGSCGWSTQSAGFSDYTASDSRFTMEQEALKILASAIAAAALPGPTSALLLKVAKDALDLLQANEKPLRLFETSSKRQNGAKFAIGSAVEVEGDVVMALGAVDLQSSVNVTNVLFWEWNSSTLKIKRAESCLSLNERFFDSIADKLREGLTANARKAIESFEI